MNLKNKLLNNIRTGNKEQENKINVLKSKIIHLSLLIQKSIEEVVNNDIKKNLPVLVNNQFEPFLENACCNDSNIETIKYFMRKDKNIIRYNDQVIELNGIIKNMNELCKPPILYDNVDNKQVFNNINNNISKQNIYKFFIYHCNYDTINNINDKLLTVCRVKPDLYNKNDTLNNKIKMLNDNDIEYNIESFNQLLNLLNKESMTIINNQEENDTNIIILNKLLIKLKEDNDGIIPNEFIELFMNLFSNYKHKITKDTINMRDFKNYLSLQNQEMEIYINRFLKTNSNSGMIDKLIDCLNTITDFDVDLEDDNDIDEYIFKTYNYVKTSINNIIHVYPNIVLNNSIENEVNTPKHWKLSIKHNDDIKNIINKHYNPLLKLLNNDVINSILRKITSFENILTLLEQTLYVIPITNNDVKYYSVFDRRLTLMLYKYYFYITIHNIINLSNDSELVKSNVSDIKPLMETSFTDEYDDELYDDAEIEIVSGIRKDVTNNIVNIIESFLEVICSNKKSINYNYVKLTNTILKSKNKEKDTITNYLKELSDENREIENIFKIHKLEKWSVGQQKGFKVYQQDTYDEERDNLIKESILEMKMGKQDLITNMNRDIFMIDELYEEQINNDIQNEVNDISHLEEGNENYDDF